MAQQEIALIVGTGPGLSASLARLFKKDGMKVALAAREARLRTVFISTVTSKPPGSPTGERFRLALKIVAIAGSPAEIQRLIADEAPYDIVFNFAALKHVRSEKDVYSILQMIDTNVVRQARFKQWIAERGRCTRYFGVSLANANIVLSLALAAVAAWGIKAERAKG